MKRKLFSGILIFILTASICSNSVMATEIGEGYTGTDMQAFPSEETDSDDLDYIPTEGTDFSGDDDVIIETQTDELVPDGAEPDEAQSDLTDLYNETDGATDDYNNTTEDVIPDEEIEDLPEDIEEEENEITTLAMTNGFGQGEDGNWYYYVNGQIATDTNSVIEGTVNGVDGWWYVAGGKVQLDYTGVANYSNSAGWWYIKNGKVDFSANTVAQNNYGWWYVVGGKVQFGYTGVANYSNPYGWWYIKNGKVDFSANTVAQNDYGWWYVAGGKVQFGYTGVANYSNSYGWWYIKNGKVDFSANTVAQNNYGWWYVVGGKVQFSYNGVANYSNPYGWWYIKGGKVDFSANTVAQNSYGWWYVVGGKVQFSYNGVANYSNPYGWWYVEGGKVIFSYNGIAQNNYGWWYIKNGKVDFSVGDYSFAANTSQIIDVRASGSTGTLTLYNKNGVNFTQKLSTSCYLGRNGVTSNKSEGDGKTPTGVYTLGQAFGVASDPGCTRSYLKLNSNYYWVDDSTSKYYNQLVDITKVSKDWSSAEHLIDNTNSYKYAIAINYNTACTPYKGSAIFLHCSVGSTTAGCVAVSESNMIKILQSLTSDTRIYIH